MENINFKNLATKDDLKSEIKATKDELKKDISNVYHTLDSKIDNVKNDLENKMQQNHNEVLGLFDKQTKLLEKLDAESASHTKSYSDHDEKLEQHDEV